MARTPNESPGPKDQEKDCQWVSETIEKISQPGNGCKVPMDEEVKEQVGKSPSQMEGQLDEFVEGGFEGWKAVLGCALICGPSLGWNFLWGVFQRYHASHFLAGTPSSTLSMVSSLQTSLAMSIGVVSGKFGDRYGYKKFIAAGCVIVFLGQLLSAFCKDLWSIFLTQGVMQGLGCGLLLPMISTIPSQWFLRHRGVATGIVIGGSSFGAAIPSLIIQEMLDRFEFRKTLLIYSFVQGATMLIGFLLIKARTNPSKLSAGTRKIQWIDKHYLTDPTFWSCWMALFFALFGFMAPLVFISNFAGEKIPNISSRLANLPIPIMSFASAIGRMAIGHVADRIGFMNAFILVISISAFSQLVLWNVAAQSYTGIMVFSVIFGLTGPCYLSLVTPIAATLYGTHNLATLTGLLNVSTIPGFFGGPPIGGVILDSSAHNWHALAAYSGSIQFAGVFCILYARFKREPTLFGKI